MRAPTLWNLQPAWTEMRQVGSCATRLEAGTACSWSRMEMCVRSRSCVNTGVWETWRWAGCMVPHSASSTAGGRKRSAGERCAVGAASVMLSCASWRAPQPSPSVAVGGGIGCCALLAKFLAIGIA